MKFYHKLSSELTIANWQEKINLKELSLDDLIAIRGDMKALESLGKQVAGFLKEVIQPKMTEDNYENAYFVVTKSQRTRAGGLDEERITNEMGEEWVADHRKPPTEYTELRQKAKE